MVNQLDLLYEIIENANDVNQEVYILAPLTVPPIIIRRNGPFKRFLMNDEEENVVKSGGAIKPSNRSGKVAVQVEDIPGEKTTDPLTNKAVDEIEDAPTSTPGTDVLLGRAWDGGPTVDLNHVNNVSAEFKRREKAVKFIRLRMKRKSLPGYELRTQRSRGVIALFHKFSRGYLRCFPCVKVTLPDAVWDGDIILLGELLATLLSPDTRDANGLLVLSIAIEQRQDHIAKFLIDRGANINLQDEKTKRSPLMHAMIMGNKAIARRMIENDADLTLVDNEGMNAFLWAAARGYLEMVALLVEKGVDIYFQDNHGWTALHFVCFRSFTEIADYLLNVVKMRYNVVEENGFEPKMFARMENNHDIVDIIEKREQCKAKANSRKTAKASKSKPTT